VNGAAPASNAQNTDSLNSGKCYFLPPGWIKWNIADGIPVYYNWETRVFSLSPILDTMSFIHFAVRNLSTATQFQWQAALTLSSRYVFRTNC